MGRLSPSEEAQMLLTHDLGLVLELADQVPEMKPVAAALQSANGWLNGVRANTDVLACYIDARYVEEQLAWVIEEMSLKKGVDLPITPGELHKAVVKALQRFVELRLQNVYDCLKNSREQWTEEVIAPLIGWEHNEVEEPREPF